MQKFFQLVIGASMALCAFLAGAVAEEWDALVDKAKTEGRVVWYTSHVPNLSVGLGKAFEEKYGIEVEIVRLTSGPLVQRFMAEQAANSAAADVVTASAPAFFVQAKSDGMFADLGSSLPSASAWPSNGWDGYTAVVAVSPVYLAYNTNLVSKSELPTKWSDLADAKWRDKVILPDPRLTPTWLLMAYRWQNAYGEQFLKQFADNGFMLAESVLPATQSLAAGEKSILAITLSGVAQPLIDKGAPIALAMIEPTTGLEQRAAVSLTAPNPNAARLFLDYLMSVDGQSKFNFKNSASLLAGVPDTVDLPSGYEYPDYAAAERAKSEVLSNLGL